MKCFPFKGSMLHTSDNIECTAGNFKSLLKLLSMFKIRIIYDDAIGKKFVP